MAYDRFLKRLTSYTSATAKCTLGLAAALMFDVSSAFADLPRVEYGTGRHWAEFIIETGALPCSGSGCSQLCPGKLVKTYNQNLGILRVSGGAGVIPADKADSFVMNLAQQSQYLGPCSKGVLKLYFDDLPTTGEGTGVYNADQTETMPILRNSEGDRKTDARVE